MKKEEGYGAYTDIAGELLFFPIILFLTLGGQLHFNSRIFPKWFIWGLQARSHYATPVEENLEKSVVF